MIQIDIMAEILSAGGILSLALAAGLAIVWTEYKKEKKALADLNASVRKDAIDNIQIIDRLSQTIKSRSDTGEKTLKIVSETLNRIKTIASKYTNNDTGH